MPRTTTSPITAEHRQQFVDDGYFILERVLSEAHLQIIRGACDCLLDAIHPQEIQR